MKISLFLFSLLYLFNCGNENEGIPVEVANDQIVYNEELILSGRNSRESVNFDLDGALDIPPPAYQEEITQKLVKNGGIDFNSADIKKDYDAIKASLEQFEAYIENESQNNSDYELRYNITLRVPSQNFDAFSDHIENIAGKVENKYSNIQDVTERYYDLQTRIKNKEILENRYLELLNRATVIKDVLEIERNLNEVRTDIERLTGQSNYLSKQVFLSSFRVNFYETLPYSFDANPRKGFFARILSSLNNGWQGFLSFLVGLTSLWPFVFLSIGAVYGLLKLKQKRKARA